MSGFNLLKFKRGEDYNPQQQQLNRKNQSKQLLKQEPKIMMHRKSLSFFSSKLKKGTVGTGVSEYLLKSNGIII